MNPAGTKNPQTAYGNRFRLINRNTLKLGVLRVDEAEALLIMNAVFLRSEANNDANRFNPIEKNWRKDSRADGQSVGHNMRLLPLFDTRF